MMDRIGTLATRRSALNHENRPLSTQKGSQHERMARTGNKAPAFTLTSDAGEKVKLSQFKGKRSFFTSTPKTTHRAAPRRLAPSAMPRKSWLSREQSFSVSVPTRSNRTLSFVKSSPLTSPPSRSRPRRSGRLWCLAREKYVWKKIDGDSAKHLPDRPLR